MSSKGAGRFRHRVILMEPTDVQDATGAEEPIYLDDTVTVWAQVEELSGREYVSARELHSEITTRIRVRFRSDVTVKWRVVHGLRVYDIKVPPMDRFGLRRELWIMCGEIQ